MTHKFMLAAKTPDSFEGLDWPMLASYKLDGIRAAVVDGVLISRNNKPIPNRQLQTKFGRKEYEGLDGELIVGAANGESVFRDTTKIVMAQEASIEDVRLHVFDCFRNPYAPFAVRLRDAAKAVEFATRRSIKSLMYVPHALIRLDQLDIMEAEALERGFEGLMLRSPDGEYKGGRATLREGTLIKVKRFHDSEAVIDGFEELQHNLNDKGADGKRTSHKAGKVAGATLGALCVRDVHTGVAFNIGGGFTEAERHVIWTDRDNWLGKVVKYKYFPTGSKDKPRFPVYLGLREDL